MRNNRYSMNAINSIVKLIDSLRMTDQLFFLPCHLKAEKDQD
jgi:hypothetical protein